MRYKKNHHIARHSWILGLILAVKGLEMSFGMPSRNPAERGPEKRH